MILSATELTRLRMLTGGVIATNEPDYLTDDQLQAEYTEADSDFDITIVYVLRLRCAMLSVLIDGTGEYMVERRSQRREAVCSLLETWERRTGLSAGVIETGNLDMNLDTDAEDVDFTS